MGGCTSTKLGTIISSITWEGTAPAEMRLWSSVCGCDWTQLYQLTSFRGKG